MKAHYEAFLRSKEQQLKDVDRRINDCIQREARINAEISRLRSSLSREKNGRLDRLQREISDWEKKQADVLRERQRYERDRKSIYDEMASLQRSIAEEDRREKRDAQEKEDRQRKQREREERYREQKEREQQKRERAAARARANEEQRDYGSPKAKKKGGFLQSVGKVILAFLVLGTIGNIIGKKDSKTPSDPEQTKTVVASAPTTPVASTPTTLDAKILTDWIGSTLGDVFAQYGKDALTSYIAGGSYVYYEDEEVCPYNFFYYDDSEDLSADALIWGVATGVTGTVVKGDIRIGETLQRIEEIIGHSLDSETYEESDFFPYLEVETEIDGVHYLLLFGPESKNLVYALAGQYE